MYHNNGQMHEIPMKPGPAIRDIQDQTDEYIRNTSAIINNPDALVDHLTEHTLRIGLSILEYYRHSLKELDFYRMKFTKIPPEDVEMSKIKNCHIGRCRCGQLLLESRDKCCPKCSQFILWPDK